MLRPLAPLALLASFALGACTANPSLLASPWPADADRVWIGPQFWANRLQDWRLRDGRIECVDTRLPVRTLHLLTRRVGAGEGEVSATVRLGLVGDEAPPEASAGLLLGAGSPDLDWRAAALVQSAPGPDGGLFAGVTADGRLVLRDNTSKEAEPVRLPGLPEPRDVRLDVVASTTGDGNALVRVEAFDGKSGAHLGRILHEVSAELLAGNVALAADKAGFWFDDLAMEGSRLEVHPERRAGPILSAMHTLSRSVLKMTAQLMPVGEADPREVVLEVRRDRAWEEIARAPVVTPGWTATFRVPDWESRRDVPYRLVYAGQEWEGTVRRDPVDEDEIVLAALSCNHNTRFGFGRPGYPWNAEALWFPHGETLERLRAHDPDLLFFAGDQIYEGASPTRAEKKHDPELDYLYKWYLWCWAFGDLARDVPCVTIPDDHDVYQGNIWGAGGRATDRDNKGGYVMPADWVRMVERTQTSHLPDPYDPTPIEQGIGVYFTNLVYGRVSFAILEDRKFKSGCAGLELGGPRPDHVVDPEFDPKTADAPGLTLLGERQLAFLDAWARDWRGTDMKAALSQSPFANLATHHGRNQDYLVADLDSNGWPQSGRNRALDALRRCFAFHVAGDQHLATMVHHGIDDWDDATWSFTMPAIANFYARSWRPPGRAEVPLSGRPDYAGSRFDGLGNRVTVFAATNPEGPTGLEPDALHDQMPGYGIVRFRKSARTITAECWMRGADAQYDGWPVAVSERSCYGREPVAWLPELRIEGAADPVVQVFDGAGALVYALRLRGDTFRPWVFAPGNYTVRVEDPDAGRSVEVEELRAADAPVGSMVVRL